MLAALQIAIDRYLAHDQVLAAELAALASKIVVIELRGWGCISARITEDGVDLSAGALTPSDARIVGSPLSLLAMAKQVATPSQVNFSGDVDVAMQLRQLLGQLDLDVEALLADNIGPANAYRVASGLRVGRRALSQLCDGLLDSTGDYLQHELRALPTQAEVQDFCAGVSACRDAVGRLQARLGRLES